MKWIASVLIVLATAIAFAQDEETCLFTDGEVEGALAIVKVGQRTGGGGTHDGKPVLQTHNVKKFTASDRSQMTRLNQNTKALEMVYALGLDVPWQQVQSAEAMVFNNDDNRTDFSGAILLTLFGAKKEVLLRVGQVGLVAGVCQ